MAMQLKARLASTPNPGAILRNFMKYRVLAPFYYVPWFPPDFGSG